MVAVVKPAVGVGMGPIGLDGVIAIDDVVVVDGVGTGIAVIEGGGGAGITGGGAAGMVEPGIVDRNDEAGCADSVSVGAVALPIVDEIAGTADIVRAAETGAIVPVVGVVAGM